MRGGRTGRGLARLRLLETYSRTLLTMAARVSQSSALSDFFAPQPLDLEPRLPAGRYLTHPQLPARGSTWGMGEEGRLGGLGRGSRPSPHILPTPRCVLPFPVW